MIIPPYYVVVFEVGRCHLRLVLEHVNFVKSVTFFLHESDAWTLAATTIREFVRLHICCVIFLSLKREERSEAKDGKMHDSSTKHK